MLAWSLAACDAAESIAQIVVAAPRGREGQVVTLADQAGVKVTVAPGGEHRSKSVANALVQVDTRLVVVHDAARPLVEPSLIDGVVERLESDNAIAGVVAATPVSDTIKEASLSRRVIRTPDRSRLWAAQTPQAFRTEFLRAALSEHADQLPEATDDAMIVERAGGEVLLHEAPAENLKVTTPLDATAAGLLLAQR